jgi:hypothetical protein
MILIVALVFVVAGFLGVINHDASGAVFVTGGMIVLMLQKILDKLTGPEEK